MTSPITPVASIPDVDQTAEQALNALDRCDRCSAQAYVEYQHPNIPGSTLLFCAHHSREQRDALAKKGFVITLDETSRLDTANASFKGQD